MKASASKENILKMIRKALHDTVPVPFPASENNNTSVFPSPGTESEIRFAEEFIKLGGKFQYCSNEKEMVQQFQLLAAQKEWKEIYCVEEKIRNIFRQNDFDSFSAQKLADSDVSITGCEILVARTGSMVLSSGNESGRTTSVYAPVHVCMAYMDQLVYDIKDAIALLKKKYKDKLPSFVSFATGPSRTADIEKTLVVGVHGPKEVYCFLIEK
jgi:L-lactate dehydrogenase complex protein LldG